MSSPNDPPFFVLAGPTACGKSELAVQVAERLGGEIVGADAFQIYRGLGLLTAQPGPALRHRVPHHLVGEIPPGQAFDVAQYLALARQRLAQIHTRGRVAIVCGGTGLYLRALIRGLADLPAASAELRRELEAQPLPDLQRRLTELDPVAGEQIDLCNPRRVIRALEVCLLTGRPFSSFREQWAAGSDTRGVVLIPDRAELHRRIDERTHAMFAAGVEDEVRQLTDAGPTASQTLGLREIRALLEGRLPREACIAAIQQATRQYAKRQLTWFRREPALRPVDCSLSGDREALVAELTRRALAA